MWNTDLQEIRREMVDVYFSGTWPFQRKICAAFALVPVCAFGSAYLSGIDLLGSIGGFPNVCLALVATVLVIAATAIFHRLGDYENIAFCPTAAIWSHIGFAKNSDELAFLLGCIASLFYMVIHIAVLKIPMPK